MTLELFLMLVMVISIFTSLTVEAIKKFLGKTLKAPTNLVAGFVSIALSIVVGVFYCVLAEIAFSAQIVIILIALVYLSWLCAMVGYDKVAQAITQIKTK